jgi:RNA polymerase sigma-70 factor (ECF subfamily)
MTPTLTAEGILPPSKPSAQGSPEHAEDATLVACALRGDRVAEAQIYRRHARALGNLAARLLGSRTDAEDVVQETFVTALERLGDLRDPACLRPWLTRITVTLAQKRLRRRRLLRWLGLDRTESDLPLDAMADEAMPVDRRAELARIAAVLETVPAPERVAWTLHRVEGETLETVAATCGCSLATVKRRIAAVEARLGRLESVP